MNGPNGGAPVMLTCFRRRGHPANDHSAGAIRWPARVLRMVEPPAVPAVGVRADIRARFLAVVAREPVRWAEHLAWLRPQRRPRRAPPPPGRRG